MKLATPKIDKRTFKDLLRQSQALAPFYTPEWATGQRGEPGQALLNIYLHLQEQVLSRLNRVPDKNFVVFLDMMGLKLLPAQSAQARVSFTLATGAAEHVLVPRGTLTSGEAADGSGSVIFQTQQDLLVTPASLRRVFSFDVSEDAVYEHTQSPAAPQPFTVFDGLNRQEHSLYLGHADLLNQKRPSKIIVEFLLAAPASEGSDLSVVWEYFDGTRWAEITRFERNRQTGALDENDGTRLFTRSGTMTLVKGQAAEIAEAEVFGMTNRWIRCRLIRKLSGGAPIRLPTVNTVRVSVEPTSPFAPDLAFNNDIPLNLTGLRVKMLAKGSDFNFMRIPPDLTKPEEAQPADDNKSVIKLENHVGQLTQGDFLAFHNGFDPVEIREVATVGDEEVALKEDLRFAYFSSSTVVLFTALRPDEDEVWVKSVEDLKAHDGSGATLFHRRQSESALIETATVEADKVVEVTAVSIGTGTPVQAVRLKLGNRTAPSKPFYVEGDVLEIIPRIHPFGKLPVIFDTFYVASDEAFSKKGARITLTLDAKWNDFDPQQADPNLTPNPVLSWEYWNGKSWRGIRVTDTTDRFKGPGTDVIFTCPEDIEKVEVNGEEKYWIRVRLIDGDYGREIILQPQNGASVNIVAGKIHFPIVSNLRISYEGVGARPQRCVTLNNLNPEDHTADSIDLNRSFAPFEAMPEESPGLFLGFDRALKGGPLGILFNVEEQFLEHDERVKVLWSYWNGDAWVPINALDETDSLTKIGVLQFLVGRDFARRTLFGEELFWMRGSFVEGEHPDPLRVKSLHPNTTSALQADVANKELAGSSNGTAGQEFALQHPLVISQQVYVREPIMPTEDEQKALFKEEGRDAISVATNELGETTEILVRWHAVEDFDDSGPQSRHYTIDQRLGRVKFGDGTRGMVPPVGADNIVASYTFGGGKGGNVAAGAISGLKSAVPFVNAVTNPLAADGGSETETLDDVRARGPLLLKNRNRAVTPEDFEALARGASRKVARAKCLPNTDDERNEAPGWVTVMIVPDSDEPQPRPTQQLVKVVGDGLEKHAANVVSSPGHINVTGPDYTEVVVEVTVVPVSLEKAAAAEASLREKLNRYIHPLTGGPCATGWEFGRDICLSEVIAIAEGVEEVDHVEQLVLWAGGAAFEGDVPLDRYTLPVSGEHRISVALDGLLTGPDPCRSSMTECPPRQELKTVKCPPREEAEKAKKQRAERKQRRERSRRGEL
ncbi:MAG TPA: putative baseplate assembly protein [Pyrinomonadaceae bacterium]|jgi:hypothetical protein|nr:putative baseplate assembly protein [Pyrinomonadaceae bacterium]